MEAHTHTHTHIRTKTWLGAEKWELKTYKRGPNGGLEEKNANVDPKQEAPVGLEAQKRVTKISQRGTNPIQRE